MTLNTAIETQFLMPTEQQPEKVLIFIITDGMENASRKFTKAQIEQLIKSLTAEKGWEFQFFGANVDAFGEAQGIGVDREKAYQWSYSKEGIGEMMNEMTIKSSKFRQGI